MRGGPAGPPRTGHHVVGDQAAAMNQAQRNGSVAAAKIAAMSSTESSFPAATFMISS
jgi:hypothetical protein